MIEIVDGRTGQTHQAKRASEDHVEYSNETTQTGVKSHAAGKFRGAQHSTVHLSVKAIGDPDLLAKRVVTLQGLGKRLSGRYYIQSAVHKISGGYTVDLKCKADGHGGYGSTSNAASKATQNKQTEAKTGTTELEVVDPRTGQTHVEYRKGGETG